MSVDAPFIHAAAADYAQAVTQGWITGANAACEFKALVEEMMKGK